MGKFKTEISKKFRIDDFGCLRSKIYFFKCGDDNESKLKCVSKFQPKHIKFEEYKKRLDGKIMKKNVIIIF